jgi:hypothetical protein
MSEYVRICPNLSECVRQWNQMKRKAIKVNSL